jgi:CubicO group peptidase (beta-lactamase class C family)
MNDTHWYVPETKLARLAATYRPDANKKIELDEKPTADSVFVKQPHTFFAANGGLVSTVSDYLRFAQMIRPNDHSNIRRDFQVLAHQAIVDSGKPDRSSN